MNKAFQQMFLRALGKGGKECGVVIVLEDLTLLLGTVGPAIDMQALSSRFPTSEWNHQHSCWKESTKSLPNLTFFHD